jgi:hypothetical protein
MHGFVLHFLFLLFILHFSPHYASMTCSISSKSIPTIGALEIKEVAQIYDMKVEKMTKL